MKNIKLLSLISLLILFEWTTELFKISKSLENVLQDL